MLGPISYATPMAPKLRSISLFGDEAGSHALDPLNSIGIVLTTDVRKDRDLLQSLRETQREIKYSKTDGKILSTCEAWIRAFVDSPTLHFRATLLLPNTRRRWLQKYKNEPTVPAFEKLYNKHYCTLIRYIRRDLNIGFNVPLLAFLDKKSRPEKDNFAMYLKKEIPSIKDVQFVNSKDHDLVQLADLLNGCLRAEFVGNVTSAKKRHKIDCLLDTLRVKRFGHVPRDCCFRFTMF